MRESVTLLIHRPDATSEACGVASLFFVGDHG